MKTFFREFNDFNGKRLAKELRVQMKILITNIQENNKNSTKFFKEKKGSFILQTNHSSIYMRKVINI